jgi:hypothetical protein
MRSSEYFPIAVVAAYVVVGYAFNVQVEVVWITRCGTTPYHVMEADPIPQREALYRLGNALASNAVSTSVDRETGVGQGGGGGQQTKVSSAKPASFHVQHKPNSHVVAIREVVRGDGLSRIEITLQRRTVSSGGDIGSVANTSMVAAAEAATETEVVVVDNVVGHVGYKPDPSITSELQVHYCYASDAPMKLAAAMMSAGDLVFGSASLRLSS